VICAAPLVDKTTADDVVALHAAVGECEIGGEEVVRLAVPGLAVLATHLPGPPAIAGILAAHKEPAVHPPLGLEDAVVGAVAQPHVVGLADDEGASEDLARERARVWIHCARLCPPLSYSVAKAALHVTACTSFF